MEPNSRNEPLDRTGVLLAQCTDVLAFQHAGRTYLGYRVTAVKQFIAQHPDERADFSTWLQDNFIKLKVPHRDNPIVTI
jgi:hypothetical protein